jgi:hypothetical protein
MAFTTKMLDLAGKAYQEQFTLVFDKVLEHFSDDLMNQAKEL